MTTHMADCRVSYCRGCVTPEIADLGVEARAALLAAARVSKVCAAHDLDDALAAEARKGADR